MIPSRAKLSDPGSGFTIIEVIVATSIALIVFGAGYTAISTTVNASNISTARIHDAENARLLFNMLQRDLSTAYAGPSLMSKNAGPLPQNGYTPGATGNPIVLNESNGGGGQLSDILQFYCRTDHPPTSQTDPVESTIFVRYGFNHSDLNAIFREEIVYNPTLGTFPDQTDDPRTLTSGTDPTQVPVLFDNALKLRIYLTYWDSVQRKYLKLGDTGFNLSTPYDSLLVVLIFGDARNGQTGNTTSVNRTYSKVFQIPSSFK